MINTLRKDKESGLEICVQTTYTIRSRKKKGTYVIEGIFSHPEPAWAEYFRLVDKKGKKR